MASNFTETENVFEELFGPENNFLSSSFNESDIRNFINWITINNSFLSQSRQKGDYRIIEDIVLYVSPILLCIGTVGNCLAFHVLRNIKSKASTYFFLAALAVMDLCVLYIGLCRMWMAQLMGFDIKDVSDILCKLVIFFGYVSSYSSTWLIVAVTVERCIAVRKPMKVLLVCKIDRAKFIVTFIVGIACLANLHFFWTVSVNDVNGSLQCSASTDYAFWIEIIWPWIDAFLYSLSPFFALVTLNISMILGVCRAKRKRRDLREGHSQYGRTKTAQMPLMLLTVSFVFLFTTLPLNVFLILGRFWNSIREGDNQIDLYTSIKTATELVMYVNHSINFFLYSATGKKFRTKLKEIFSRLK